MGQERREVQEHLSPEVIEGKTWTGAAPANRSSAEGIPKPPLHFLSSLLTVILDGLWGIPEVIAAISVVGLPLVPFLAVASGLSCAVGVAFVQRWVVHDEWGSALLKGLAIGLLAGLPVPLTGVAAGVLMLIWSGVYRLWGPQAHTPIDRIRL